jgi:hypothetical protein
VLCLYHIPQLVTRVAVKVQYIIIWPNRFIADVLFKSWNKLLCRFLKEQRPSLEDEFSYLDDTVIYHLPSGLCPICTQPAADKLSPITVSLPYFCSSSDSVFSKYVYWLGSCSHSAFWGLFCRHPLRISAKSKSLSMFLTICHASTYKHHLEILNKHIFRNSYNQH